MPVEKILFATKFREPSYQALMELLELKKVGLREIVLLNVIPREEVAYVPFGGYLRDKALEMMESAKLKFQEWEKELQERGLRTKIIVEVSEPVAKILEIAELERVDLLVIGRKRVLSPLSPEIPLKIVSRSKIPVLIYRRIVHYEIDGELFQRENVQIFKKPLLATDFSESSKRAAHFLMNFNALIEKLFVVHILKEGTLEAISREDLANIEAQIKVKLHTVLEEYKPFNIKGDYFLGIGDPPKEILEFAREKESTLIVLGKTGKGLLKCLLLGSVSKELIHHSEIPLLIVP
ncbi:MAG: universal stress protein [Caldimicrobium sp.]|nr:universal stress protein [Caldimicrobium sp.]MCX7874480.1 universal stress protein [Caldimicrobium sp.]MDW8094083.1 universal stress protein [Caldimicrobium sp.]